MLLLRSGVFGTVLLLAFSARATPEPDDSDDPKWCRVCHTAPIYSAAAQARSIHDELVCRDCHQDHHFNPHEAVKTEEIPNREVLAALSPRAPGALAACYDCHDEVGEGAGRMRHGSGTPPPPRSGEEKADPKARTPYCLDCHGNPHTIPNSTQLSPQERRGRMDAACVACHADPARMASAEAAAEPAAESASQVLETYEESIHGRKVLLGSSRAPGCASCHAGHGPLTAEKAREACLSCHPDSNERFASLIDHRPVSKAERPVAYYTQRFFAPLTVIVIFLLVVHVLLDLLATLRAASRARS